LTMIKPILFYEVNLQYWKQREEYDMIMDVMCDAKNRLRLHQFGWKP